MKNKTLEGANLYVKADYTQSVLQKRKDLQEELKKKREQGENVVLRYDKIITLKGKENKQKKSQKRDLSESPGKIDQQCEKEKQGNTSYQSRKKTKTYDISTYMQKASSPRTDKREEQDDSD